MTDTLYPDPPRGSWLPGGSELAPVDPPPSPDEPEPEPAASVPVAPGYQGPPDPDISY